MDLTMSSFGSEMPAKRQLITALVSDLNRWLIADWRRAIARLPVTW